MSTIQEKILLINRDTTLTNSEKMEKIRELTNQNLKQYLTVDTDNNCFHYKKTCSNFHFECCDKYYNCCRCHNEQNECVEKSRVDTIECDICKTTQSPNDICLNCQNKFSRSYCSVCKIWSEKNIFHCDGCGLCRVGERNGYFHCVNCNLCFDIKFKDTHECLIKINPDSKCGYCLLNVFDSQNHLIILKCGHTAHKLCSDKSNDYRCPLCRKSLCDMTNFWKSIELNILQHPLPDELQKKVNILCYDCNKISTDVDWHFMGMKCAECNGYNTSTD